MNFRYGLAARILHGDHLPRERKIADLIAIGGTLDYVVPDIDR